MVISKQNEKCSFLKYQTTKLYLLVEGISDSHELKLTSNLDIFNT